MNRNTRGIITTFENLRLNKTRFVDYDTINWSDIKPFKQGKPYPDRLLLIDEYEKEKQAQVGESQREMAQSLPSLWNRYYEAMDERWFREEHNVNEGRAGDQNRSEERATGMAILRFLNAYQTKATIKTLGIEGGKKDLQTMVGKYLSQMNPPLSKFPTSYDNIRKLVNRYSKAIESGEDPRSLLLHGNSGNSHRKKLDEAQELIMQELYLQPKQPDAWSCWRDYTNYFRQQGLEESKLIGYTRFKQYFATPEMQIIAAKIRNGSAYYEAFFRPFILGKMPEHSMSLISGDGWEPGRSVKFKWINRNGEVVDRIGTMNVWYWIDWKSKYILSHRISGFENSKDIRLSFRDIIALYDGRVPRSVMIDNKWQKQKDISRMLKKAGVMTQDKAAYHPQTNYIERINRETNKLHRQLDEHWVDMTNTWAAGHFKHNDDHIRGVKPLTEQEFHEMILKIIHTHNNTPYKSLNGRTPQEVFQDSFNPDCGVMDPLQQSWIFGDSTVSTVRRFTVSIDIATRKYQFIIPNEYRRKLTREIGKDWKVKIYYDERHMDTVDLYAFSDPESDHTDRYICTALNADSIKVNRSSVESDLDQNHSRNLGYQKAGINVVDEIIEEFQEEQQASAKRLNIDLASVKAVSQDHYKESMSNEVARAYNRYYEDQLDTSFETVEVDKRVKPNEAKAKLELLEKKLGNRFNESPVDGTTGHQ